MLNKEQIMEILPHRPPMLLVDEILEMDENHVVGALHLKMCIRDRSNNSVRILTFLCAYAIIKRNKGVVGAVVPPRGRANILGRTLLWFCMK